MTARRLDAHNHFWNYSSEEYPWIKTGSPLHRNWLPGDLETLQTPLGFDGSIAVQARQSLAESRWLLELAHRHPRVAGVVGWVDLRASDVERDLAALAEDPRFVGVRHVVQDEPDARFLLGADFVRGLKLLSRYDLTYDLLIFPSQLPAAVELVGQLPEQAFVLDHCAKPPVASGALEPWHEWITRLAAHPNVCCKVSGLVTEADWQTWSFEQLRPYLDVVENVFGRSRLLWGSDWPVCLYASAYERWAEVCREWVLSWSPAEQAGFWGGNTARFYGVDSDWGNAGSSPA